MLPLTLLKTAINHPMLVELKNGETYNGHLASCDAWMNVYLTQVICTSRDGDRFWKMPECYIRGSTIKYIRIPDEVLENYKDDSSSRGGMMKRDGGQHQHRGGGGGGNRPGQQRGGGGGGGGGGGNRNNNNNNRGGGGGAGAGNMGSSGANSGSTGSLAPKPAKQQRR